MKSETELYLDYSKAMNSAAELNALGENIKNGVLCYAEQTIAELKAGWSGENAEFFCGKIRKTGTELSQSAQEIITSAENVRKISTQIYNAEMRALEIAKTNTASLI